MTENNNLIPINLLFKDSDRVFIALSPDGKWISYLSKFNNSINIYIQNLATMESKNLTSSTNNIFEYYWVDNSIIYFLDKDGSYNNKIYHITLDKKITSFDIPNNSKLLKIIDNENILIENNQRDKNIYDVYKLNIKSSNLELISKNRGDIYYRIVDLNNKIRVAFTRDGFKRTLLYRETESSNWIDLEAGNYLENIFPLAFKYGEKNIIYVSSNVGRDKRAYYEYHLDEKRLGKLIFENDIVDISYDDIFSKLIFSEKRKKLVGVYYILDKKEYFYFDEERKYIQESIDKKLPNKINSINFNKNEDMAIIVSYNDHSPREYYIYDKTKDELRELFSSAPWLKKYKFAEVKPITFTTRDNIKINGYLTLPIGKKKNLPLVVFPHGGPWWRDYQTFSKTVQFLANRGFAVLQMNFRFSRGFGKKLFKLGFKERGRKMQEDIRDGALWAIKEGIANPEKIGFLGSSYGGYAALMATIKDPDFYKASVSLFGTALNLTTYLDFFPAIKESQYLFIGDPIKDKELLVENSPLLNCDKVKIPLLFVQGENDFRVYPKEREEFINLLKNNKGFEYIVKKDEGHGFRKEENQLELYNKIESFLKKYICS